MFARWAQTVNHPEGTIPSPVTGAAKQIEDEEDPKQT